MKIVLPTGGHGDREKLGDTDVGLWLVTTEVSAYLVDLDDRRILRLPGVVAPDHFAADGCYVITLAVDADGEWCDLVELLECRVGAPLQTIDFSQRGHRHRRHSTFVQRIDRSER